MNQSISTKIASEIIANLKMICLALFLCALYMGIYYISHTHDRKPVSEVPWRESCYDPVFLSGNWNLDWHYHYRFAEEQRKLQKKKEIVFGNTTIEGVLTPDDFRWIMELASIDDKTKVYDDEHLISIAKKETEKDRKDFESELQSYEILMQEKGSLRT